MYMLDTNILVYAIRHPSDPLCDTIIEHALRDICISSITYAELELGVLHSSNPMKNMEALISILTGIDVLDFDQHAASEFADIKNTLLRAGTPIEDMDILIGAHARSLNYTLVTNNTKHFKRIPELKLEDWIVR